MEERLQKIIANRGLCSRREAEKWIEEGRVKVDGKTAELGQKVDPDTSDIVVNGRSIAGLRPPRYVIAINKPRGYVCSNRDEHADKLVFELLPRSLQRTKLFVAGRLDKDSSGLVIVTNDGEFAQALSHPSGGIEKRYLVKTRPGLTRAEFDWFLQGQRVDGELLRFERIIPPKRHAEPWEEFEVILCHGKKREIRRLIAHSGKRVHRLNRLSIGRYTLKGIAPGDHRILNESEVQSLLAAPVRNR